MIRNRRNYSSEQREEALRLAEEVGPTEAGRKLGIPRTTINRWRQGRARATTPGAQEEQVPSPARPSLVRPAAPSGPVEANQDKPAASSRRVKRLYTPSERSRVLELAAAEGVSAAARKYGVCRFSIYEWQRRARLHGQGQLADSPVAGGDEDRAAARDRRILAEWRAHPGLGPSQVRNQLRRQGFKVSLHTVRCVLEEDGYVPPKVRREPHDRRYEAVRPNHLWHLDFLHRHIHKQKVYVLLVLDDFSRFIVGGALWDGERVAAVTETFLAAVNRHGKPEKALSDGGSAFYSWRGVGAFTRLLEELEVDQIVASVPESNGKLEVLNANIQKELFNQETFFDLGEAQRRLSAWIHFYNFRRTHHALGGLLVPADRYFGRSDEVLAAVESGHSPEGLGEPLPVGERRLDLLRLTSQRGQLELYVLGHRIPLSLPASV